MEIYLDIDFLHRPYGFNKNFLDTEPEYEDELFKLISPDDIDYAPRYFMDEFYECIKKEAQQKEYIQQMIAFDKVKLVSSFVLLYEILQNPVLHAREKNKQFIVKHSTKYISSNKANEIVKITQDIMNFDPIRWKDAMRLSCAIYANCDYFISYDYNEKYNMKNLLKYLNSKLKIITPSNFIILTEKL